MKYVCLQLQLNVLDRHACVCICIEISLNTITWTLWVTYLRKYFHIYNATATLYYHVDVIKFTYKNLSILQIYFHNTWLYLLYSHFSKMTLLFRLAVCFKTNLLFKDDFATVLWYRPSIDDARTANAMDDVRTISLVMRKFTNIVFRANMSY